MTARPFLLALLAALAWPLLAVTPAETDGHAPAPGELSAAIQHQLANRDALQSKADDAQAALRKWYHGALDAVKKDAISKGNLDDVMATDAERDRLDRDLTAEEREKLSPVQRTVRAQYDQARLQLATQQKGAVAASLRAYMAGLETLEKRFTQKLDLAAAIAVRKERAAAAEQLSAPDSAPLAVLAATPPPKPSGAPPTPTPASEVPPGHSLTLTGRFDASDDVVIQKAILHIEHRRFAKPLNLTVNGQKWEPAWTGNRSEDFTGFTPPLAAFGEVPVVVKKAKGRPVAEITQQPAAANDGTMILHITDSANGAADLELSLVW